MKRAIVDYHRDDAGDWVAELDCGHDQHVRHRPPFTLRPWVTTNEGRESMLGERLECLRCDRFELPEGAQPYRETPEFTEQSIPRGLLAHHSTKTGVWGRICVREGELSYCIEDDPSLDQVLTPERVGIVVPERRHRVAPIGAVRFKVQFLRRLRD